MEYGNVINEIQKYCAGHIDMSQGMVLFGMKTLHLYDFQSSRNNSKKAVKESALVWDIVLRLEHYSRHVFVIEEDK